SPTAAPGRPGGSSPPTSAASTPSPSPAAQAPPSTPPHSPPPRPAFTAVVRSPNHRPSPPWTRADQATQTPAPPALAPLARSCQGKTRPRRTPARVGPRLSSLPSTVSAGHDPNPTQSCAHQRRKRGRGVDAKRRRPVTYIASHRLDHVLIASSSYLRMPVAQSM